ncbi:hypothetical protein N7527_009485 [Penicillium freii]|nr:hypothetical protein N7527_009485 [Penicillium freii]
MTALTNIRGFHPNAGPTRNSVAKRPTSIDDTTWSNMVQGQYRNITSFRLGWVRVGSWFYWVVRKSNCGTIKLPNILSNINLIQGRIICVDK